MQRPGDIRAVQDDEQPSEDLPRENEIDLTDDLLERGEVEQLRDEYRVALDDLHERYRQAVQVERERLERRVETMQRDLYRMALRKERERTQGLRDELRAALEARRELERELARQRRLRREAETKTKLLQESFDAVERRSAVAMNVLQTLAEKLPEEPSADAPSVQSAGTGEQRDGISELLRRLGGSRR